MLTRYENVKMTAKPIRNTQKSNSVYVNETELMDIYKKLTFTAAQDEDIKRENANIDGDTAMGTMLKYGSEG